MNEQKLKEILGRSYCGPSLSIEDGIFIIYRWGDAPVSMDILASGKTLEECIKDYEKSHS